jgi:hypothetical protein
VEQCSGPYSSHPLWQSPCYLPRSRPHLRPKPVRSLQRTRFSHDGIAVATGRRDSIGNGMRSRCGPNPGLCGLSIGKALTRLGYRPICGRANGTCPGIDAGDGGTQVGIAGSSENRMPRRAWRGGADIDRHGRPNPPPVATKPVTALPLPAPINACAGRQRSRAAAPGLAGTLAPVLSVRPCSSLSELVSGLARRSRRQGACHCGNKPCARRRQR